MNIVVIQLTILLAIGGGIAVYVRSRGRPATTCPACGQTVAADAVSCPHCGRRAGPNLGRMALLAVLVIVGLLVFGLLLTEI